MISAYQSALSGLQAYSTKIDSHANNIANSQSSEYKKTRVTLSETIPYGVKTNVEKVDTPGDSHFELTENGYERVELSNVNLGEEFVQINLATSHYKANLKTIEVTDQMTKDLLDIKA